MKPFTERRMRGGGGATRASLKTVHRLEFSWDLLDSKSIVELYVSRFVSGTFQISTVSATQRITKLGVLRPHLMQNKCTFFSNDPCRALSVF